MLKKRSPEADGGPQGGAAAASDGRMSGFETETG